MLFCTFEMIFTFEEKIAVLINFISFRNTEQLILTVSVSIIQRYIIHHVHVFFV